MTANTPTSDTPTVTAAVLISTDDAFRDDFRRILEVTGIPVELGLEIDRPFTGIGDPELEELRGVDPGLIIVDLEADPQVGLRFIQFLVETGQSGAMVAVGRDLSPDLLLQAIQAGVTEVLAKPLDPEQVEAALRRVFRKTGRGARKEEAREEPGRAVVVFGAKGGVGTTALATNLAVAIHRLTRQRTLLLDLDVELGEAAFLLGMEPKFSLLDLIRNFHRLDSGLLSSFIEHHESGIEVLAAPFQPADFDAVNGDRMRQVLGLLRKQFEWVIIDKPKGFHPAFDCVFEDAAEAYMVTTPDLQALRNITRSLPLIRQRQGSGEKRPLRLVVNRYEPNQVVTIKEIEATVGLDVFHSLRNDYDSITESINRGSPAVLRRASSYGADVRRLAGAITEIGTNEEPRKGALRGLMGAFRKGRE